MPKLAVLSGAEVCGIRAGYGFVEARRRGTHIVMQCAEAGTTTTIPVPNHTEVRRGTLKESIRQSGLPRQVFEVS